MAHYETMYIVHPALEAGRLKDLIVSVESTLKELGGTTHTIETWGKKKLAYPINKEKYGMYVLFQFEADGSKNKELNLTLDHNTNILAYLTTKIDQEQLLSNNSS
jgi:small subunit ribosomal protein S6